MKKIVELLIDWENLEFDDLGVEVMSLVDAPAIGVDFLAFAEEKFVDPKSGESEEEYVSRCIPVLIGEGYDEDQAAAICYNSYATECEDCFDLEDACQEGYVAIGLKPKGGRMVPNCVPVENEQEFASYNDYPEAAKNNAKRAIEYAEENGWGDCGTAVGKARAHQLAKGENITEDTIARMASFARHKQNSDTPYGEGCGGLMWDAWGGTAGIEWAQKKLQSIRDEQMMELYLQLANKLGETISYEDTIYIDGTKQEFTDIGEWMKGIGALDILGKMIKKEDEGEIKYRYAGPTAERPFCKAMLNMNKVYTMQELQQMGSSVGNGIDSGRNSIMRWKGGPNCRHYFEKVRLYKDGRRTVIVSEGPATENEMGVTMESRPRGGYRMMTFSNDEEMIVSGPAMIPQQLILRRDEQGNPFHVYFSKDTIKNIARKFFEYNKMNNTDIDHDEEVTTENTLLESWIVSDPDMDKSKTMGFNVPQGTWMVSYKINNESTWNKIKEGKINGFSIAGNFIEVAKKL